MGWSSGTELVEDVANAIKKHVTDPKVKRKLYDALVIAAINQDWDNEDEVAGLDPILDKSIKTINEEIRGG